MSLNIKNPEAHRLAAELSELTGESMARAVTKAIRERLDRLQREADQARLASELVRIGRKCASYPRQDDRTHGEFLYDAKGLPS